MAVLVLVGNQLMEQCGEGTASPGKLVVSVRFPLSTPEVYLEPFLSKSLIEYHRGRALKTIVFTMKIWQATVFHIPPPTRWAATSLPHTVCVDNLRAIRPSRMISGTRIFLAK